MSASDQFLKGHGAAVGCFVLALAAAILAPSQHPRASEEPRLPTPELPTGLAFSLEPGKARLTGDVLVALLPSCNSCTLKQVPPAALKAKLGARPLIVVTPDKSGQSSEYAKLFPNATFLDHAAVKELSFEWFLIAPTAFVGEVACTQASCTVMVKRNMGAVSL